MAFGITAAGFVPMTLTDIKEALQLGYQTIYGNPNLADDSVIGIRIGIMAKMLADAWETLHGVYNAPFPSLSDDASFPNVMDINGLAMLPATKTLVTCQCTGTPGTVITVGSQVKNATDDTFELTAEVTIPGGGVIDGVFQAVETGPVPAPMGGLTTIYTPISGWDSVTNAAAGVTGVSAEEVTDARIRRQASLQVVGASALDAIVAKLRNDVANVSNVIGFENDTDVVDSDGRDPHSMEFVVSGGLPQDIANILWATKSGGIALEGAESVTVVDSTGKIHTMHYTIPSEVQVLVEVTITEYTEELLPTNYVDLIKAAVAAYGNAFPIGRNLLIGRWVVPVYGITGVDTVTVRQKKTSGGSWETTDVAMDYNEQTVMTVDDVTVIKA
jgi:uncharacterized phage protein gp47/JayE